MDITGSVSSVANVTGAAQTGNTADATQQKQAQEIKDSQPQEPVQPVEESVPKSDGNTIDVYAQLIEITECNRKLRETDGVLKRTNSTTTS